jgi:hypothetical protein
VTNEKQEALDLIERLPDGVSIPDIIGELCFKLQIDEGLKDVAEGRTITHTQLRERLAEWRKTAIAGP